MFFRSFPKSSFRAGFSLFELLIVLFIMIVLTVVVATKFPTAVKQYTLSGAAQDVALIIRGTQQYNVNVTETSYTGGPSLNQRYGVNFNVNTNTAIFFVDNPLGLPATQRTYNSAVDDRVIRKITIDPSITMSLSATVAVCPGCIVGAGTGGTNMTIFFDRPNLAPIVRIEPGPGGTLMSAINAFRVTLTGPDGKQAFITVSPLGVVTIS